jgi:hypothetical protein
MNKNLRQEVIEKKVKQLDNESFKDLVFDGWKESFKEKLNDLIKEKYDVTGFSGMKILPWDTYNIFTGFKERFYYFDDPVESAKKYFETTKYFEVLPLKITKPQPKKTNKKK